MRKIPGVGKFLLVVFLSMCGVLLARGIQTPAQSGFPTPQGPPTVTPRGQLGGAEALPTRTPAGVARTPTPRPSPPPSAAECLIEPRTIDELLALAPTAEPTAAGSDGTDTGDTAAVSVGSAPTATANAAETPTGVGVQGATSSVVGQIQSTVRELTACSNAGDLLSVWAFFTDDFVTRAAAAQGALFNTTVLTARSVVEAGRRDSTPPVSNVQSLSGGRVSARFDLPAGSLAAEIAGASGSRTVVFLQQDGRWLIDEVS